MSPTQWIKRTNANMINEGLSKQDRLIKLNELVKKQIVLFQNNKNIANVEHNLLETK